MTRQKLFAWSALHDSDRQARLRDMSQGIRLAVWSNEEIWKKFINADGK